MGPGCLCGSDFSDLLIAEGKQNMAEKTRVVSRSSILENPAVRLVWNPIFLT